MSSYLCMSFLSEGFFELRLHCLWSRSGWGWGGVELVLSLTSKLIMLTQSVPVISFFSQPFFKRAATPTRRTAAHTHIHTACIKNSCHTRRYKDAHGSGGKAARRQQLTSEECGKVLRGGGEVGRTTGCERASNRSAAKLLKLIKFRLCQHCAYASYAFLPPLPTSFAPWHSEGERTAQPFNFLSDICQTSTDV